MASAMRKMAVYLGLVEDDRRYQDGYDTYGEYDEYDEPADVMEAAPVRADYGAYVTEQPLEPAPPRQVELARITTLHPRTYNEARNIGEHFREGTPVIMNLTEMVDSDARRLVDFAARVHRQGDQQGLPAVPGERRGDRGGQGAYRGARLLQPELASAVRRLACWDG